MKRRMLGKMAGKEIWQEVGNELLGLSLPRQPLSWEHSIGWELVIRTRICILVYYNDVRNTPKTAIKIRRVASGRSILEPLGSVLEADVAVSVTVEAALAFEVMLFVVEVGMASRAELNADKVLLAVARTCARVQASIIGLNAAPQEDSTTTSSSQRISNDL